MNERKKAMESKKQSHFVTISREYGCEAYPIAAGLRDLLNKKSKEPWMIFSRPIIEKLIEDDELDADYIHELSDTRYWFADYFIDGLVPDFLTSPQSKTFEKMHSLNMSLAEMGNCIIIGSAAQILTTDLKPDKFAGMHVRIIGSMEFRIKKLMETNNLNRTGAERLLKKKQSASDNFVRDFTRLSVDDPYLYHITFNRDHISTDFMIQTLYAYLEAKGIGG